MTLLAPSAAYFAVVFAAGFALGAVRVMWLVPAIGVRAAELTELPLMVVVVVLAARWVNRRFLTARDHSSRFIVGLAAFTFLLLAEVFFGVLAGGMTPRDVLFNRDPVSGTAYYVSLCLFALMPWYLGRSGAMRPVEGHRASSA